MSKKLPVRWSQAAVGDLESMATHLARDSVVHAERTLEKLYSRAKTLETSPSRGRIVPELAELGLPTWWELIVSPYRVLYRVTRHSVDVLGVFDGRRDLEDVLLERLLRA
jgi:plasmid stabilization system protein ParE